MEPEAQSCPGGRLPETTEYPMCEVGYEGWQVSGFSVHPMWNVVWGHVQPRETFAGNGCANCNTSFGRSDSSAAWMHLPSCPCRTDAEWKQVLVCVKCANGWFDEGTNHEQCASFSKLLQFSHVFARVTAGLQLTYFLLSDTLLLAVATSSVLGASATRQDSGHLAQIWNLGV